ncbi:MAG: hypothetical protein MUE97_06595 [Phycisphaerales bacterium]|jgi:phospholipid N-methyltransferase|nr:hypothetical protein [Phycisphaerales bacterium]
MASSTSSSSSSPASKPAAQAAGGGEVQKPLARAGTFAKAFVFSPGTVGAIAPSSQALAAAMVRGVDFSDMRAVIEYGPGCGSFTGAIRAAAPKGVKYFAIELSPKLAERFAAAHPDARLYIGSATEVAEFCRQENLSGHVCVDAVFSGLPFASFGVDLQRSILERTVQVLRPGGIFRTFAYSGFSALTPAGRRFRKLLHKHFGSVTMSKTVWKNLPPAFVYSCRKEG